MDADPPDDSSVSIGPPSTTLPTSIRIPFPKALVQSGLLQRYPPRIVRDLQSRGVWTLVLEPEVAAGMQYVDVAVAIADECASKAISTNAASGMKLRETQTSLPLIEVQSLELAQHQRPEHVQAQQSHSLKESFTTPFEMTSEAERGVVTQCETQDGFRGRKCPNGAVAAVASDSDELVDGTNGRGKELRDADGDVRMLETAGTDSSLSAIEAEDDVEEKMADDQGEYHPHRAETEGEKQVHLQRQGGKRKGGSLNITLLSENPGIPTTFPAQKPEGKSNKLSALSVRVKMESNLGENSGTVAVPMTSMSDTSSMLSEILVKPYIGSVSAGTPGEAAAVSWDPTSNEPPQDGAILCEPAYYAIAIEWRKLRDRLYRTQQKFGLTKAERKQYDMCNRWSRPIDQARKYAHNNGLAWPPIPGFAAKSASTDVSGQINAEAGPSRLPAIKQDPVNHASGEQDANMSPATGATIVDEIASLVKRQRKRPRYTYEEEEGSSSESGANQMDSAGRSSRGELPSAEKSHRKRPRKKDEGANEGASSPGPKRAKAIKPKVDRIEPEVGVESSWVGKNEHVQVGRCINRRYKGYPMCGACIGKSAGDGCRFVGFRTFPIDPVTTQVTGAPWWNECQDAVGESLEFPDEYNIDLTEEHKHRTQQCVAAALLPVITQEWLHATVNDSKHKPVLAKDRVTCDFCATSIFGGSWFCISCGKEYCLDCKHYFADETAAEPCEAIQDDLGSPQPLVSDTKKIGGKTRVPAVQGLDPDAAIRLLRCRKIDGYHKVADLLPVTRWTREQVYRGWLDILQAAAKSSSEVGSVLRDIPWHHPALAGKAMDVAQYRAGITSSNDVEQGTAASSKTKIADISGSLPNCRSTSTAIDNAPQPSDPAGLLTHAFFRVSVTDSDNDLFDAMWAEGVPVVVDDLLPRFKLKWSPEAFAERAGEETCPIIDCQSYFEETMRVADFFQLYQTTPEERGKRVSKLRDWPSTTEFRLKFPDLFEDFSNALPFPDYTRRDGVLNITSHFPANAACPDIGPKMYNAFSGFEGPGGYGSTRLHMDMADAINVLMHANPRPDGSPGCARWDIFRAEDADAIRTFLRNRPDGERFTDPIHSQIFFLDSVRRQELYAETGVYSHRIYQYPGQAVFIPAGCAHQVCNLSDCIKIACDFVSPHNVERCAKLTKEFRSENLLKMKAWKADVLQLNNTMWYAWLSCIGHTRRAATYPERQAARLVAEDSAKKKPRKPRAIPRDIDEALPLSEPHITAPPTKPSPEAKNLPEDSDGPSKHINAIVLGNTLVDPPGHAVECDFALAVEPCSTTAAPAAPDHTAVEMPSQDATNKLPGLDSGHNAQGPKMGPMEHGLLETPPPGIDAAAKRSTTIEVTPVLEHMCSPLVSGEYS